MTRKITDQIAEVEHELSKAHEARDSADAEYRSYLKAEDMGSVRGARDAMRRHDAEIEVLGDRLEVLRQRHADETQRQADQRLKQAVKRAESAAEKERMAAAEVGDIAERMAVLLDRLAATSSESFRSTSAMIRAAGEAGKDAPVVRTPMSREGDPRDLLKHGQAICRAFDMQDKSAIDQTSRRRKAG